MHTTLFVLVAAVVRKASPNAPRARFPLRVPVSTVDRRYAGAIRRTSRACAIVAGTGTFLLQRSGSNSWKVLAEGPRVRLRLALLDAAATSGAARPRQLLPNALTI